MIIFERMKWLYSCVFLIFACFTGVFAQDNNDLQLAKQFAANGEEQKALDIYQKLYKQDNDQYFSVYVNVLLDLKKFDEAERFSIIVFDGFINTPSMFRALPGLFAVESAF